MAFTYTPMASMANQQQPFKLKAPEMSMETTPKQQLQQTEKEVFTKPLEIKDKPKIAQDKVVKYMQIKDFLTSKGMPDDESDDYIHNLQRKLGHIDIKPETLAQADKDGVKFDYMGRIKQYKAPEEFKKASTARFEEAGKAFNEGNIGTGLMKQASGLFNYSTEGLVEGGKAAGYGAQTAYEGGGFGDWQKKMQDNPFSEGEQTASNIAGMVVTAPIPLATLAKAKNIGMLGKTAIGALAGAEATTQQTVLSEGRLPTKGEVALGAGVGGVIPVAGRGIQYLGKDLPQKLYKSALKLSPTQKTTLQQMTNQGEDLQSLIAKGHSEEEAAKIISEQNPYNYLIEKGYSGEPGQIAAKLEKDAQLARKEKAQLLTDNKFVLSASSQVVQDAKKMGQEVVNHLNAIDAPAEQITKAQTLLSNLGKTTTSTPKVIDEIKSMFDKELGDKVFKGNRFATGKDSDYAQRMLNVRSRVQKGLEEIQPGLKEVNKKIQISKEFSKAISKQDIGGGGNALFTLSQHLLGNTSGLLGGALGAQQGYSNTGSILKAIGYGLGGAVLGRIVGSPSNQIKLANLLKTSFGNKGVEAISKAMQGDYDSIKLLPKLNLKEKIDNALEKVVGKEQMLKLKQPLKMNKETTFSQDVNLGKGWDMEDINKFRHLDNIDKTIIKNALPNMRNKIRDTIPEVPEGYTIHYTDRNGWNSALSGGGINTKSGLNGESISKGKGNYAIVVKGDIKGIVNPKGKDIISNKNIGQDDILYLVKLKK